MSQKDFIKWKPSGARKVLLNDLEHGIISVYKNEESTEYLWETTYKKMSEFKHVPYLQFKEKLKDH